MVPGAGSLTAEETGTVPALSSHVLEVALDVDPGHLHFQYGLFSLLKNRTTGPAGCWVQYNTFDLIFSASGLKLL